MAIGDKIDWRAGTIDPTTLQLIASAGAAQGAMYQSLGESVSKALEKDSEDYIVAAGKAFDKADKLYDPDEPTDPDRKKKREKLVKKGINLFRKAGEKYNIVSGGWESGSRLMTEKDIYEFYGFDPKVPVTGPSRSKFGLKSTPPTTEQDTETETETEKSARRVAAQGDFSFGGASKNMASIAEGGLNPNPLLQSDVGIPEFIEQIKDLPDGTWQNSDGQRVNPSSQRNMLAILSELTNLKESHGKDVDQWGQRIADTAAQAVIAATPKAEILSNYLDPVARQISSFGHDIHDSLLDKDPKDFLKHGLWGKEIGGYLEGAAKDTLDLIQKIPYSGRELSRDTLAQMNQPVWEADSAPTTEGDYSKFENSFNSTPSTLESPFNPTPPTSESLVPPPQPPYFLSEEQYNMGSNSFIYNPSDFGR